MDDFRISGLSLASLPLKVHSRIPYVHSHTAFVSGRKSDLTTMGKRLLRDVRQKASSFFSSPHAPPHPLPEHPRAFAAYDVVDRTSPGCGSPVGVNDRLDGPKGSALCSVRIVFGEGVRRRRYGGV